MAESVGLIWVRGVHEEDSEGGTRTGLWEKDPAHPGGEVKVVGPEPVQVARTSRVNLQISNGFIEQCSPPSEGGVPIDKNGNPLRGAALSRAQDKAEKQSTDEEIAERGRTQAALELQAQAERERAEAANNSEESGAPAA